jgi:hypothetical protein
MRLPAPSPTGVGLHAGSSDRALVCAILLRCTWGRQCFALRTGGGSKGPWRKATVPVDSFAANPWGLYNVHGNVWEWTEDCWNQENVGNPGDGTARAHGDCGRWLKAMASGGRRVLRPIHACPRATCSPPPGAVRFRTPCGPASGAGSSGRSGSLPPGAGRSLRSPACCPLGPRPPSCRAGRSRPTPRRPRHWLARPG